MTLGGGLARCDLHVRHAGNHGHRQVASGGGTVGGEGDLVVQRLGGAGDARKAVQFAADGQRRHGEFVLRATLRRLARTESANEEGACGGKGEEKKASQMQQKLLCVATWSA